MSLAELVGVLVVVALVASLALAVIGDRGSGARAGGRVAFALRMIAVVATAVVASLVAWPAWQDSGSFAFALIGIPVASALLVLGVSLTRRSTMLVTWAAAAVILTWSLLTGLGVGFFFLGPAVLMLLAAVASTRDRRAAHMDPTA